MLKLRDWEWALGVLDLVRLEAARGPLPRPPRRIPVALALSDQSRQLQVSLSYYCWILSAMFSNAATDDSDNYARSKFGTQKGISSDEYFNKGAYDPNSQAEAKTRLQGFEGATAISSNAYFGRPEEDIEEEYGDLESAAKDFVRKFGITASDDLENLTNVLGEGATRLQGAIRNYLGS